jgi:peptidoglycan/xylan/chitin deacetylase (PgdA/CDA1 family)
MQRGNLPSRAACVTFDDGYADNAKVALPILRQYDIPATVFVASGYLNGGRMWNDTIIEYLRQHEGQELDLSKLKMPVYSTSTPALRRKAAYDIIRHCKYLTRGEREKIANTIAIGATSLPDDLMLTTEQLLTLHQQGVEIGGHTYSHPILSNLPFDEAREEIRRGKSEIEAIIDEPLRLFAYPNGRPNIDYISEHVRLVREAGFEAAVTTHWGVATARSDFFQLPRFTPWDKSAIKFLLRMALNSHRVAKNASGV